MTLKASVATRSEKETDGKFYTNFNGVFLNNIYSSRFDFKPTL